MLFSIYFSKIHFEIIYRSINDLIFYNNHCRKKSCSLHIFTTMTVFTSNYSTENSRSVSIVHVCHINTVRIEVEIYYDVHIFSLKLLKILKYFINNIILK